MRESIRRTRPSHLNSGALAIEPLSGLGQGAGTSLVPRVAAGCRRRRLLGVSRQTERQRVKGGEIKALHVKAGAGSRYLAH
jgi:hypothetical protein